MKNALKISFIVILYCISVSHSYGQNESLNLSTVNDIITRVRNAQASIKTLSYTLKRTDTLLTGDTRYFSGKVIIQKDNEDAAFGFKFWSTQNGDNSEQVYNGRIGYLTNSTDKSYILKSDKNDLQNLLYSGGGRLIVPDFLKLDTLNADTILISQDDANYYITMRYPDLLKYNVNNRSKVLTINKSNMLPFAMRNHQETLGKVQDLYYRIEEMKINESAVSYDFISPPFLKQYIHSIPLKSENRVFSLKDKIAPSFELETFDGKTLSTKEFDGKLTLIDFWEVWCGPCIESMPKIQKLYDTYKSKGLNVYGITNDIKQLQTARLFIKNQKIQFPMLIGNQKLKQDYKFSGTVPLYILIDKKGKIALISEGFPPNLEEIIQALL